MWRWIGFCSGRSKKIPESETMIIICVALFVYLAATATRMLHEQKKTEREVATLSRALRFNFYVLRFFF